MEKSLTEQMFDGETTMKKNPPTPQPKTGGEKPVTDRELKADAEKGYVLEPCPFCGVVPKLFRGKYPIESEGVICQTITCALFGVGFSPADWNTRPLRLAQAEKEREEAGGALNNCLRWLQTTAHHPAYLREVHEVEKCLTSALASLTRKEQ